MGTLAAILVPLAAAGLHATLVVWATALLVTAGSIYYGKAILGGVVGDYIGGFGVEVGHWVNAALQGCGVWLCWAQAWQA